MNRTVLNRLTWRQRIDAGLEAPLVRRSLIALILLNAVILGLETSPTLMTHWGSWLLLADQAILTVFVIEITLRLLIHRLAYFKDA